MHVNETFCKTPQELHLTIVLKIVCKPSKKAIANRLNFIKIWKHTARLGNKLECLSTYWAILAQVRFGQWACRHCQWRPGGPPPCLEHPALLDSHQWQVAMDRALKSNVQEVLRLDLKGVERAPPRTGSPPAPTPFRLPYLQVHPTLTPTSYDQHDSKK